MEFSPNDFRPYSRSSARFLLLLVLSLLVSPCAWPQQVPQKVDIQVQFDQPQGALSPVWNYFGYDEPNYTYAVNGRKLLGELAALGPKPAYVRVHNLLTTGDGAASLKWGSTNVYTEDAAGKPVYSWTILDQIFDAFHAAGIKPLVEIGFMPEALSTHPVPYRHNFPQGSIYTGWAYPPKDYQKWSEVVFQFVHHLRERYGDSEVKTWLWEVWNEPDIDYWQGTPEEYFKLYDFSVDAVLRALPGARVGGPDSTGPANPRLRSFCGHSSSIVLTSQTMSLEKPGRGWTLSASIPRAHRSGRAITCRWASRASWLRFSRASRSWRRFRSGAGPRSFWVSLTRKDAPPVRRGRIRRIPIATDPCTPPTQRRP